MTVREAAPLHLLFPRLNTVWTLVRGRWLKKSWVSWPCVCGHDECGRRVAHS